LHLVGILFPHTYKLLYNKSQQTHSIPNLFWYETLNVSGSFSVHPQESSTVHSALAHVIQVWWQPTCRITMELQFYRDPARRLSSDLYNMCQCRMYSGWFLRMGRETARNT